jgi:hypothetical protein
VLKREKDKDMINRDKVKGLKYLIIALTILVFMGLVSSSETFAQFSTFSGSGGYGYPGSFYGGYPGYGYPYGGYSGYSMPYGYAGYSRYGYPGSSYGPMSDWTPWRSSSYYPGYSTPGGYTPFTSMPYYSSLSSPFSSYYPKFIPTSYWSSGSAPYPTTSYSSSKGNTIVTITGKVVGSYSINSNGREIKCYVHLPQQAVFQPLDLSKYLGKVVEVSGYLISQDLYGASIERVI